MFLHAVFPCGSLGGLSCQENPLQPPQFIRDVPMTLNLLKDGVRTSGSFSPKRPLYPLANVHPFLPNLSAEGGVLGGTTFVRSQHSASRSFLQGHLCIAKKGHTEPVCGAEDLLEAGFGFTWIGKHNDHLKASFSSSRIHRRISQTLKCWGTAWRPC